MDIKIDTPQEHFKFRVVGIVEHNNKYLVVKIADNNFYCLLLSKSVISLLQLIKCHHFFLYELF